MGSGVRGEIAFRAANVTEFARIQECTDFLRKRFTGHLIAMELESLRFQVFICTRQLGKYY